MTATARETKNLVNLEKVDYKGSKSTLCNGCGHNSISAQIIDAAYEMSLDPRMVIKLSGIGCSSKAPAYFLGQSHGFNTVHGRMPSVATGATLANHKLIAIGVSGDGDTGSIGLGQFKHMLRRNVPMVYIIENNGVYGLTKGQFSATADEGQRTKYEGLNELPPLDLCLEAVVADCTFVARSFSGDRKQVTELLKAALAHKGTALVDIISPCVTFNDHDESTKSYAYGRAHNQPLHDIELMGPGLVIPRNEIDVQEAEYDQEGVMDVQMHDGSTVRLKKIEKDYDPRDKMAALRLLTESKDRQHFITGLIYIGEPRKTLAEINHVPETPLALLAEDVLRPSKDNLAKLMAELS